MRLLLISIISLLLAVMINPSITGWLIIKPEAYISISFDDSLLTQYEASKTLDEYGFKGTFYVLPGLFGKSFENNSVMNYSLIKDIYERGHEIGCHTMIHVNMSTINSAEVHNDLIACKEALNEFNVESFCYPYGAGTEHEAIVKQYFSSARVPIQEINHEVGFNIKVLIFVHERMMRLDQLREWINEVKINGGWIVLTIHGVTEEPRGLIDITPEEYKQILDVVKESGLPVKTIKEVING